MDEHLITRKNAVAAILGFTLGLAFILPLQGHLEGIAYYIGLGFALIVVGGTCVATLYMLPKLPTALISIIKNPSGKIRD